LRDSKHSVVILRTALFNCPADIFPKLCLGLWPMAYAQVPGSRRQCLG
jgi:hypothetical protein